MARPNYGPGHHLSFDDYPRKVSLVVGEKIASNSDLFSQGQTVRLTQTPKSGQAQGDNVVGEELPEKRMVYTDTGEDSSFNLKLTYYGWGEFYLASADADYFSYRMTKGMSIQAGDWSSEKNFETQYFTTTQVPNTEDMQQELDVVVNREVRELPHVDPPSDSTSIDRDAGDGTVDGDGGTYTPGGQDRGYDEELEGHECEPGYSCEFP